MLQLGNLGHIEIEFIPKEPACRGVGAGIEGIIKKTCKHRQGGHRVAVLRADEIEQPFEIGKIAGAPARFGPQSVEGTENAPTSARLIERISLLGRKKEMSPQPQIG